MNRSRVTGDLASHGNIFVDIANDRVGIGSTIPGQKLSLPDSAAISLGDSADLRISFDGGNAVIRDHTGNGSMRIANNNQHIQIEPVFGQFSGIFKPAEVMLFHSNVLKFQTAATGVTVHGSTDPNLTIRQGSISNSGSGFLAYENVDGNGNPRSIAKIQGKTAGNGGYGDLIFQTAFNNTLSTRLTIENTGNSIFTGDVTLTDTTADSAAGPELKLFRNSASPADADYLGQIKFAGESDTGVERNYAKITGKILDASNGTEDGILEFAHIKAGSQVITGRFRSDSLQLLNGTQLTVAGTTTLNSPVTVDTSTDEKLILSGSTAPYIRFKESSSNKAYIQWNPSGYIELRNQEDDSTLYIKDGLCFSQSVGGTLHTIWHSGNDGTGSGLDADTLDGVQGSSYLRSNATDTASGAITFTSGALQLSGHWYSGFHASTTNYIHLYPNGHSGSATQTNIRAWNGTGSDVFQINGGSSTGLKWRGNTIWTAENDGSGSGLDADTLDGVDGANYVRTNQNTTITSDLFIGGGGGGITVNAGSDIRFTNGDWTGNVGSGTAKIQHHSNILYISGGSSGIYFREGNDNRWIISDGGHFVPGVDSTYDIGTSGNRVRNGYFDTLYGDGSNITGVNATTLDSIDSGSFLRSDAADVASGAINFTSSTLTLSGHWYSRFHANTQNYIHLYPNGHTGNASSTDIRAYDGNGNADVFKITGGSSTGLSWRGYTIWTAENDGTGSGLDADKLDGKHDTSFLRSDAGGGAASYNATSDIIFSGGGGAVTIAANSDIEFGNGTWTGNTVKIQHHSNFLYIVGGSNGIIFREGGTDRARFDGDGHFRPASDSTYNLGDSSNRWAHTYTDALTVTNGVSVSGDVSVNGGAGAISVGANSDIRLSAGNWTGDAGYKIQAHSGGLYIQAPIIRFRSNNGSDRWYVQTAGHFEPSVDTTYDIGSSSKRVRNVYAVTFTGSAAGLTASTLPTAESGISAVGNFGQWEAHGTYNNFNAEPNYWGWNYIQGNTNAPNTASGQWYRCRLSLGSDYGKGSDAGDYSMEMTIPRTQNGTQGQMWVRPIENGVESSWMEVGSRPYNSVIPRADNAIDLGSSSIRWANLYTADAHFNNIGTGGNEIDGTEGSWTLQEAEDTVYMINRKNGKRYKIKMEEV